MNEKVLVARVPDGLPELVRASADALAVLSKAEYHRHESSRDVLQAAGRAIVALLEAWSRPVLRAIDREAS